MFGDIRRICFTASFASLALAPHAVAVTGPITTDVSWSGTVVLTGDVTVTPTGRLTIAPGTRVEAQPLSDDQLGGLDASRVELIVQSGATLQAAGTQASPIVFTSHGASPAPHDWHGIRVASDSTTLGGFVIEFAHDGLELDASGSATITDCMFHDDDAHGLLGGDSLAGVHVAGCTFQRNGRALEIFSGSLTLEDSTVTDNETYGVLVGENATVRRTVISDNGGYGVFYGQSLTIEDCDIERNGDGIFGGQAVSLLRTSVADNDGFGVAGEMATVTKSDVSKNGIGINAWGAASVTDSSVIGNGSTGVYGSSSVSITGSVIQGNAGNGVASEEVSATESRIRGNALAGIEFWSLGAGGFSENCIELNAYGLAPAAPNAMDVLDLGPGPNDIDLNYIYEIRNDGPGAVKANGVFWGEPTTTQLASAQLNLSKIRDIKDDSTVGQVAIQTWASQPQVCFEIFSDGFESGGTGEWDATVP